MTDSAQLIEIERTFGLSPQLARLLQLLLERDRVRKDDISTLISTYHSSRQYHNADRMVVYRLKDHGVVLLVQYGEGYYLSPADKSIIRGRLRTPLPASS
jgi:hypothetical protein